jgi:hypothetical protein
VEYFFQGELGAAAALAGLLFVSMSVNQTKILELGRMADRGLEALAILFVVINRQLVAPDTWTAAATSRRRDFGFRG